MDAFFLNSGNGTGQRFCLFHSPPAGQRILGGLVYIHPFAEEVNRSRRMAALQTRAFSDMGFAVLQIDLHGCGDSSGDFADASWDSWVSDVTMARAWLSKRIGHTPWLWGLRAGCLLAAEVARDDSVHQAQLLFWQPVTSGHLHLGQFLRLKFAADLVQGSRSNGGTAFLIRQLAEGHTVEIAGYGLSPLLASGFELANLDGIPAASRVACLELSGAADAELSPAITAQLSRWTAAGSVVSGQCLEGAPFWQAVEVELCPALIEASLAIVTRGAP